LLLRECSNVDDLVSKLQHRFDALPVHRLCYYQSYYSVMEVLENLRQTIDAEPSAGTKVDSFGMTSFHILALSQTPILSLFQAVLKVCKVDIILTRDKFGSTPLDYLCLNHTPEATKVIQSLLPMIIDQRLQWLGAVGLKLDGSTALNEALPVEGSSSRPREIEQLIVAKQSVVQWWKTDMLAAMDRALAVEGPSRKREIGLLCFKLATHERREAMSMLELALWNLKSGANVVIQNVLPFLDKVCVEDYCDDRRVRLE
jgi:hypothetical protein